MSRKESAQFDLIPEPQQPDRDRGAAAREGFRAAALISEPQAAVADRNRAEWIDGVRTQLDREIREFIERVRETWEQNRPSIGHDQGPDINWSR